GPPGGCDRSGAGGWLAALLGLGASGAHGGCGGPRAEPRADQQSEERDDPAGPPDDDETERRDRGSERQDAALAESLGEKAGRDLKRRHPARVRGADQTDLRERQAEFRGPQWQEDVERLGKTVRQEIARPS